MNYNIKNYLLFGSISLLLWGCPPPLKPPTWNYDKSEITDNKPANIDNLNVDVYLDVTGSMEGFSIPGSSNFGRFIDDIEATCQNTWKKTDIKYFKYGSRVDSISREEFVSAKSVKKIFTDRSLNNKTDFANTIKNTDPKRVSILITDLFYSNNDINSVVASIKEQCVQKGIDIGVVGVTSDFNGSVGDLGQGIERLKVNAPRSLFALVFGDKTRINQLFKSLKNKPYIIENQFLLFSGTPTNDYEISVEKDRQSKEINKNSLPDKQLESYKNIFAFRMKEREKTGLAHANLVLQQDPLAPIYSSANVKPSVFRKKSGDKDSVSADNEIKINNLKVSGSNITADVEINNSATEGMYSYAIYLSLDNTVPLNMPKWIKTISTDSIDGVAAGKTLNLEKLLTDISTSHTTARQPKIAKFYIYLDKK